MRLRTIIGTAVAALGLSACGSTVATTVSPTLTATVSSTLAPTGAPTPTAAPTPTVTPTTTPTATTLGPSGVLVAQLNCDGVWTASVTLTGFPQDSPTNYIVSVTNNLGADGADIAPYTGISFGPDPSVDVNGIPTDGDHAWGASGSGDVVGDFLKLTISPATGGNAGGVGYYGESTTVLAPEC
jgi:hypothetical protein